MQQFLSYCILAKIISQILFDYKASIIGVLFNLNWSNYRKNILLILFIQYSKLLEIWAFGWRKCICHKNINCKNSALKHSWCRWVDYYTHWKSHWHKWTLYINEPLLSVHFSYRYPGTKTQWKWLGKYNIRVFRELFCIYLYACICISTIYIPHSSKVWKAVSVLFSLPTSA